MYVRMHGYMILCMYIYVYVCMYACMDDCMYVCKDVPPGMSAACPSSIFTSKTRSTSWPKFLSNN